eukprot:CAMPEP_0183297314 /NCGR_PEP_ID=MMETSP0160_2-20130417/4640_1 /TAXON_ID=2839 ORGANISM="Odontella Sinensis, Strain Grunow 1884" /NCGR_SAMPLE_ID=MMETSP0160_2 /ASSEMBLY_ACC=CAM_ASM_000250 /LENGTH=274 /DNA_ID=CAMNT_0025459111 /DNA_START=206 /DNA_END=1030 /DNA_ORIENTATION=-
MTSDEGTSDTAVFLKSLKDPDIIERVRATIKNAHVFKLPPRQTVSVGWRGADWKEKVWQGTVKVVERGDMTAILLVDRTKGSIFAVCPVREGAIDRCVDSSRYFVLRIENASGRHMFIGVAFNERSDAFDFNAALEDSRREKEFEKNPLPAYSGPSKDYSIKEGQKIHVAIPKVAADEEYEHDHESYRTGSEQGQGTRSTVTAKRQGGKKPAGGGFLAPSSKDTPSRTANPTPAAQDAEKARPGDPFFGEPFSSSTFGGSNPFKDSSSDDPFFS